MWKEGSIPVEREHRIGYSIWHQKGDAPKKIEKLFDVGILHRAPARAGQPFTVLCFCILDVCGNSAACYMVEYMPERTWVELALFIAQGIRLMPHIIDHPDWQVCLTLDGFSSHLVPAGLAPFTAANITFIKEEGDTMQVNQAYDQSVTKEDTKVIRELLNLL